MKNHRQEYKPKLVIRRNINKLIFDFPCDIVVSLVITNNLVNHIINITAVFKIFIRDISKTIQIWLLIVNDLLINSVMFPSSSYNLLRSVQNILIFCNLWFAQYNATQADILVELSALFRQIWQILESCFRALFLLCEYRTTCVPKT